MALLEKHKITDKAFIIGERRLFPEQAPRIMKSVYEKEIGNFKVHVEFETHLESATTALQDAWVVTK